MVGEKKTEAVDPGEKEIFDPSFNRGVFLIWHQCRHLTEKLIIAAGLNQSQSAVAGKDGFGLCSCRGEQENILARFIIFGDEQVAEPDEAATQPRSYEEHERKSNGS